MRFSTVRAALSRFLLRQWLPKAQSHLLQRLDPYQDWIQHNQLSARRKADLVQALAEQPEHLPRISVVMPVYRPDLELLEAAIVSVRNQCFTAWQLCICDDGSNDPVLTERLFSLARQDPRICITSLAENAGISAATNAAAMLATGDVLLLLDQDDLLSEDCLAEFALAFATDPDVDLAYSDHDKIDRHGQRHAPQFKPAWSPTLLLSHMYFGHALALRKSVFDAIGGMRSSYDGSQDYDLALRASEQARRGAHIPKVLYHWRALPGSTAVSANEKPGSIAAGQACLADALRRRGIPARVAWSDWAQAKAVGLFELAFTGGSQPLTVVVYEDRPAALTDRWLEGLQRQLPERAQVFTLPFDGTPLGLRLGRIAGQLAGQDLVLLEAGLAIPLATTIEQIVGYAALPGTGAAGPLIADLTGAVAAAGLLLADCSDTAEAALRGADRNRAGMGYVAQSAHECLAIPTTCMALDHTHACLLGELPPDADDPWALGLNLCEALRDRGGQAVCVASSSVRETRPNGDRGWHRPKTVDRWYNPNLGSQPWQFQPIRRGPEAHRSALLRIAATAHNLDREGAQLMLLQLLSGLHKTGIGQAVVFSPKDGALRPAFEAVGAKVVLVPSPGHRARGKPLQAYIDRFAALFQAGDFDVVLANTLDSYPAVLAAQRVGVASIWWQHEGGAWNAYFRKLGWRTRALAYAAFALPYRVIQVAESTRQKWLPIATRANFEVLHNGIDADHFAAMTRPGYRTTSRKNLGLANDECCILLVGSISARKGQADIVCALARLDDQTARRVRILIVGAQVDRAYCRRLNAMIGKLKPDRRARISLVGAVDDPAAFYAAADIFVCCSRQESAPLAIVEAMAAGLPIVSTSVDGIPELVIFGQNAREYQYSDAAELSNLLQELVSSPITRERLGQASRDQFLLVNDHHRMIRRFAQILGEAAMLKREEPSLPD